MVKVKINKTLFGQFPSTLFCNISYPFLSIINGNAITRLTTCYLQVLVMYRGGGWGEGEGEGATGDT